MIKKFLHALTYFTTLFVLTFSVASEELNTKEILDIIQKDLRTLERAVYSESFQKKSSNSNSLREVGVPSRNTLHGKGVWSKRRIGVTGMAGSSGASGTCKKYTKVYTMLRSASLQDVLILAAGRQRLCFLVYTSFYFWCFFGKFF